MTRARSRVGAVVAVLATTAGFAVAPVLTALSSPSTQAARIMSVSVPNPGKGGSTK